MFVIRPNGRFAMFVIRPDGRFAMFVIRPDGRLFVRGQITPFAALLAAVFAHACVQKQHARKTSVVKARAVRSPPYMVVCFLPRVSMWAAGSMDGEMEVDRLGEGRAVQQWWRGWASLVLRACLTSFSFGSKNSLSLTLPACLCFPPSSSCPFCASATV
jgi:hypothetical protein